MYTIHKTENPLLHKAQYTLWSLMSSGRRAKQYVYTFAHTHTTYVYTHMYIYIYIYTLLANIYIYMYNLHKGPSPSRGRGDHQMLGHIYVYIIIYICTYTHIYHIISYINSSSRWTQHPASPSPSMLTWPVHSSLNFPPGDCKSNSTRSQCHPQCLPGRVWLGRWNRRNHRKVWIQPIKGLV